MVNITAEPKIQVSAKGGNTPHSNRLRSDIRRDAAGTGNAASGV
jgi:hypothetical protein